ncbi:hypothetical protein [Pararhodobacter sp.]|nr:hypothetical protein [Pararhodobacter sp.]
MSVRQKEDRPPFTQEQAAWIRAEIARVTPVKISVKHYPGVQIAVVSPQS